MQGLIPKGLELVGKHSPIILAVIGAVGVVGTAALAVKATPKAMMIIEEYKEEHPDEEVKPVEIAKAVWKVYIPAAVCGVLTIAAISGGAVISQRRVAAGAIAADIAWGTYENYREVVIDKLGSKKEDLIRGEADARYLRKNQAANNVGTIAYPSTGDQHRTLCFDRVSARYFYSDIEYLRHCVNELNAKLLDESWASLNDWYELIGIDTVSIGEDLGWTYNDRSHTMVDMCESSVIAPSGEPCFCINFNILPRWL